MGFYGTIIDRANEVLKFDRIFENRRDMDLAAAAGTDGVFAGHFVLVQYDRTGKLYAGDFYTGYKDDATGLFYADAQYTQPLKYATFTKVSGTPSQNNWEQYWERYDDNIYLKLPSRAYFNSNQNNYYTASISEDNIAWLNMIIRARSYSGKPLEIYYQCTGEDSNGNATWTLIHEDETYGDYFKNYFIDRTAYGLDRNILGYDSTVWEKVYEGGAGHFILIAHLNGMMPGLQLYADPPSAYPTAPYLDAKTTDALYRVHVPSHWGFNFKEEMPVSEGGLSEQTITYNKRNYNADGVSYTTQETEMNADIYLNKRAMEDKNYRYTDTTTVNEVTLQPTGISGKRYSDENGNFVTQPDIMELSVHLPAIGNAVSDVYDIIYGYNLEDTAPQQRYTDIEWINGSESDDIKYNGPSGNKTHDLNTIAGLLNTVHDRLGQIIVPLDRWLNPSDEGYDVWIAGLNGKKCIYSYRSSPLENPSYYRLSEDFIYQDPENGTFKYEPVDFTNNTLAYQQNTFYYLQNRPFNNNVDAIMYESNPSHASAIASLQIDTNGSYTPRPDYYYYKKSIAEIAYTPIELEFYIPNKFFLKNDTSYLRDHGVNPSNSSVNAPTNPYAQYYYIDETNLGAANANVRKHEFTNGYSPRSDFYYVQPGSTNYLWAIDDYPNGEITYYTTVRSRYFEQQNIILYKKNLFYYSVGTGGQKQYFAMRDNTYAEFQSNHQAIITDNSFTIYWLEFEDTPVITLAEIDGELQTVLSYPVKENGAHPIPRGSLVDIPSEQTIQNSYTNFLIQRPELVSAYQTLYFQDENNNYIDFRTLEDLPPAQDGTPQYAIARPYYILGLSPQELYIPGRYYIRVPDNETGNYYICWDEWNPVTAQDTNYYTIREVTPVISPFYEPNTYYFKDSENAQYSFETDQTAAYSRNHIYHNYYAIKQKLYVESDSSGRCPVGYEWNEISLFIPASVVLKQLVKRLKLVEMVGMDNGMSSINGAILQLAQEYCPESKTRDTSTFRGSLNKIQDMLYTISKLIPGKIVYVNDFGQLTTGDVDYNTLLPPTTQGTYVLKATVAENGTATYSWQNA